MTIIALPKQTNTTTKQSERKSRRVAKALRRQSMSATAIGAVAVTLTGLSLTHLAHGVAAVTGANTIEAWAMAVGIDVGFVAMELAQIATVGAALKRQVTKFARPATAGTLAGSAAMNAYAFASQTTSYPMMAAAITMGVAIPALVYALTRVGAALYIDGHARG